MSSSLLRKGGWVGSWELLITLISSNLTFLHSILMINMLNAQCMCSCLIVCKQYKHAIICHIVLHKYLYHTQGFNIHILFISTINKLWLTPSNLGRFNHLSSCLAPIYMSHVYHIYGIHTRRYAQQFQPKKMHTMSQSEYIIVWTV